MKQKKMGIVIEKPIGYSISKSGILNLTRFSSAEQGAPKSKQKVCRMQVRENRKIFMAAN